MTQTISQRAAAVASQQMPKRKAKHCPVCDTNLGNPDGIRSVPQLRRYFSLIRAAFQHWPEGHERQFSSPEELRAFLQMKAGHRVVGASIPLAGINKERALLLVEAGIRAAGSMAFPVIHGSQVVVFRPKSIAFDKLDHTAACKLMEAVEDVILAETGLQPDQLLSETEGAA